jgi:hypothetical protein
VIVEGCPVRGAEIEVPFDADAIEKLRDGLALRGTLDDLQIADEASADIGLCLVHFDGPSCPRQRDRRRQSRRPGACNTDWTDVCHLRHGILSLCVRREFRR